jgi:hypothetical protein
MTPEQIQVVKTVMEDYRTSLRPLTIAYSIIATHFRRPASLPDPVNNEVRNAFDHLSMALEAADTTVLLTNARQALWHLLIARCNLLRRSSDIVRSALEASLRRVVSQGGTPDPRIAAVVQTCAEKTRALNEELGRSEHPLPIGDPAGNLRKMVALNTLLDSYLNVYRDAEARGLAAAALRSPAVTRFTDEQVRVAVNLRQQYDAWIGIERGLAALPHALGWRTVDGIEELWRQGAADVTPESAGPRSDATEALLAAYQTEKAELTARRDETLRRLEETTQLYRLLQLPLIASEAAPILRELDRRSLLGTQLLVIGTNAIPAYALEAAGFLADAPDETRDFDLAWTATATPEGGTPVWSALKAVDPTYTINTERTWQALNAAGYAVDLLAAPSRASSMLPRDRPRPVEADTQEWLLNGRPVDHVVVARDGSPARLVVPDPRWFALHKLWLCAQDARDSLKRDKDSRQGTALMNAVEERMPHYRLDDAFQASLPAQLVIVFRAWRSTRPAERRLPTW